MRLSILVATLALQALFVTAVSAQEPAREPVAHVPPDGPVAVAFDADRVVQIELPALERRGELEAYVPRSGYGEGDDGSWRKVCASPCSVSVPVGTRLRVNGDFRESAPFTAQNRGAMRLAVVPARSGLRTLGIVLTTAGTGIMALAGTRYLQGPSESQDRAENYLVISAFQGVLLGAVLVGVGAGLAARHWRTRVSVVGDVTPSVPIAKGVWWTPSGLRF